jgi:hypothetical protein
MAGVDSGDAREEGESIAEEDRSGDSEGEGVYEVEE